MLFRADSTCTNLMKGENTIIVFYYHNERTQKNITDAKGWGTVYARMMGLGYLYQTLEPLIYRVWCYPDNYEVTCLSYKSRIELAS